MNLRINTRSIFREIIVVLLLMSVLGCSKQIKTGYGFSSGASGQKSPAGFTLLRSYFQEKGKSTYTLKGLNNPATKLDGIVWIPQDYGVPSYQACEWFEKWLKNGNNRTLVYLGRDDSPIIDYWQLAADRALPADRVSKLRELSLELSADEVAHNSAPGSSKERWFFYRYRDRRTIVENPEGPWSDSIRRFPLRSAPMPLSTLAQTEIKGILDAEEKEREEIAAASLIPKNATANSAGSSPSSNSGPSSDTNSASSDSSPTSNSDSNSTSNSDSNSTPIPTTPEETESSSLEYQRDATIENDEAIESEVLVSSSDGIPLIFELRKNSWGSGKILVFANGSLLCNLGLATSGDFEIVDRILESMPNQRRIGFLESDHDPRNFVIDEDETSLKGFEMLTVWPISLISMHVVLLGILAMVAMLPIFGRGQATRKRSTRDFGQHIEALGRMLHSARDRNFAMRVIADYFRLVRKEPSSPWAIVAAAPPESPAPSPTSASPESTIAESPQNMATLPTAQPLEELATLDKNQEKRS